MAWTNSKADWASGELATAEDMNAVSENLAARYIDSCLGDGCLQRMAWQVNLGRHFHLIVDIYLTD